MTLISYLRQPTTCDTCRLLLTLDVKSLILNFQCPNAPNDIPNLKKCRICSRPTLKNLIDQPNFSDEKQFSELLRGVVSTNFQRISSNKNVLFVLDFCNEFLVKSAQSVTFSEFGVQVQGSDGNQYKNAIQSIAKLLKTSFVVPEKIVNAVAELVAKSEVFLAFPEEIKGLKEENKKLNQELGFYIQEYNKAKQNYSGNGELQEISFLKKQLKMRENQLQMKGNKEEITSKKMLLSSVRENAVKDAESKKSQKLMNFTNMYTGRMQVSTNEMKLQEARDIIEEQVQQIQDLNSYIDQIQNNQKQMRIESSRLVTMIDDQKEVEIQNEQKTEIIQILITQLNNLHKFLATTRISPGFKPNHHIEINDYIKNTQILIQNSNYSNSELIEYFFDIQDLVTQSDFVGKFCPVSSTDSVNLENIRHYYTSSSEIYIQMLLSDVEQLVLLPNEPVSLEWEFGFSGGEQFIVCLAILVICEYELVEKNDKIEVVKRQLQQENDSNEEFDEAE